ncbi:MAG: ABC transporter ATP-binding protein [bacterium]
MAEAAIQIHGLKKNYRRGLFKKPVEALRGVDLEVPVGEVVGFLGPNGAGKTTTLKILLNFIYPTAGEVLLFGSSVRRMENRRRIGFLPETANYYPYLTPRQTLRMYAQLFGMRGAEARRRIDQMLEWVGLDAKRDEKISTFSKGMTQRVGIAQALINDPDLMILDEPASGLDPLGRREMREVILRMKAQGKTVFFSSHELGEVEAVCDHAAVIFRGQVARRGTLDEMMPPGKGLRVRAKGLGIEQARALKWAEKVEDVRRDQSVTLLAKESMTVEEVVREMTATGGELLSVERVRPTLEDVFLEIVKEKTKE